MKTREILVVTLVIAPLCSLAFFPPKEKQSSTEVLRYRNVKKEEYRQERENYEQKLVDSRKQVMAEMDSTPWKANEGRAVNRATPLSERYKEDVLKNSKTLPPLIFVLIIISVLIGIGVKKANLFARDSVD